MDNMETIGTYIQANMVAQARARLVKLIALVPAGDFILEAQRETVAALEAGFTCRGDTALLDLVFSEHTVATGRGGKVYLTFTTAQGRVNFFPKARWGAFIALATQ